MTNAEARQKLIDMGAEHLKREDNFGDTKNGWWMDDCFLAPYRQAKAALAAIEGN